MALRGARRALAMGVIGGAGAAPKLLDLVSGAILAVSMRKLKNGYSGQCLRLRRDSDNAESDFGFGADGIVDQAAIATWLGAAAGYVTTWYDQSGTSNNVTQTTAGAQALYVANVVQGHPVVRLDGTNHYYTYANNLIGGDLSAFIVAAMTDTAASRLLFTEVVAPGERLYIGHTTAKFETRRYKNSAYLTGNNAADVDTNYHIIEAVVGTTCVMYLDGTIAGGTGTALIATNLNRRRIGSDTDNGKKAKASYAEIVVFNSGLSDANRQTVEADETASFF